jgi:hypothetical protein
VTRITEEEVVSGATVSRGAATLMAVIGSSRRQ